MFLGILDYLYPAAEIDLAPDLKCTELVDEGDEE